ncbi:MATE family efflux transporter [Paenibacillus mendelii]|uniref:Probable multidrug resistance protein NorM n=1 Tax=Paenibacillus mendelii TaxID=206163 RepID=A0ABV6JG38_9BACL|nr:MATE family efflux transporter [Paenibacillus mendelii]MCQ6557758.1 MATE family efflux transporter [Paenibacillus mendelii]
MYHAQSLKQKLFLFLSILGPIIVTQISYIAMNVLDTMMSGRAGTNDLAGVAMGSSLWMPLMTGINAILLAVTPIIGHLIGQGNKDKIANPATQAIYLSTLLAVLIIGIGVFALDPILAAMNLDPSVSYIAKHYLIGISFGLVPLFASYVIRYFFEAQGYPRITMIIMLISVPINGLLNYGLIFGHFGFPRLGGIGSGYATAITYWFILIASIWMTFKKKEIRHHQLFVRWYKPSLKLWKEQLAIGIPMGLSTFFEASIFAVVTLFMGMMFNTATIAAHQATLNFTSLLFMIPLSISMALTILVSYEAGAGRRAHAKQYGVLGVSMAVGLMGLGAILLYFMRGPVAWLYTEQTDVMEMIKHFLLFAIFFQLSDSAQASLQGVLRGYKDVTIPFIVAFVSYWIIGIPAGYALSAYTDLGPYGFWVGITAGLTFATIGFFIRLRKIQKRPLPESV